MGHIDANFGNDSIDAVIDLNYKLSNASFIFPPQSNTGVDGISPGAKREFCLLSPTSRCQAPPRPY